jgi:hypothetical protein
MEQKEEADLKKMVLDLKKDVKDSIKIRKKMTVENIRYLKENADYVKDTSKKVRAEFLDRGDKYTLEIDKTKVLKEIFCFNHEKNYINMIEQAEINGEEKSKFKQFKQQVEKSLDVFLDKNYFKLLYEKHKKETEKTKIEENFRKQQMTDQKMSKSQAAKFYAMNSSRTFRRKQLLTSESVKHKEVKSPKEECKIYLM